MQSVLVICLATSALVIAQEEKAPRFSIGLGVLAPSYSQKFAGNGRLDFDQDKNGFSYSLNNVPHTTGSGSSDSFQSQSNPSASSQSSGSDYAQPQPHFSIYQHRANPKQSESSSDSYHSPSQSDYSGHDSQAASGQPQQFHSYGASQSDGDDGSYRPDTSSHGEDDGSYKPEMYEKEAYYSGDDGYKSSGADLGAGQQVQHQQSGGQSDNFPAYNFEANIQHQYQDQPQSSYQSYGQQPDGQSQSYDSQPSQSYQAQPSQYKPISLQSQPSRQQKRRIISHQPQQHQQQHQYNPHKANKQMHRV